METERELVVELNEGICRFGNVHHTEEVLTMYFYVLHITIHSLEAEYKALRL